MTRCEDVERSRVEYKNDLLVGTFPVLPTPFESNGAVDYDSMERLVEWCLGFNPSGLVLFAMGGEGSKLTDDEKTKLLERVSKRNNKLVPIVVAVDHNSIRGVVELSRKAIELGADAILSRGGAGARPGYQGIIDYFSEMSNSVDVPIVIQDLPVPQAWQLDPPLLASLLANSKIEHIKVESAPTPERMEHIRVLCNSKDVKCFGGLGGRYFVQELRRGAVGIMPGVLFIDVFNELIRLFGLGKIEDCIDLHNRYVPAFALSEGADMLAGLHKYWLADHGVISDSCMRSPSGGPDGRTIGWWKLVLKSISRSTMGRMPAVASWV